MTIQFYPNINIFTAVTNSYPCIFTLVIPIYYKVNEFVSIRCPLGYGMRQIDGITGRILSVNIIANEITVDIDTTGFDPFIFVPLLQLPQIIPAGEIDTLAAATRDNTLRAGYVPT